MIALTLVAFSLWLPAQPCTFNGHAYDVVGATADNRCCDEEAAEQYATWDRLMMDATFTRQHFHLPEELQDCGRLRWQIDATEYGWVLFSEPPDPNAPYKGVYHEMCDYSLESNDKHSYHPYTSLARPEELDGLTKCACGDDYSYPSGLSSGGLICNGDYSVTSIERYYESELVTEEDSAARKAKQPKAIDLERRAVYCDVDPYLPRGQGCVPDRKIATPSYCDNRQSCAAMDIGASIAWPFSVLAFLAIRRIKMTKRTMRSINA